MASLPSVLRGATLYLRLLALGGVFLVVPLRGQADLPRQLPQACNTGGACGSAQGPNSWLSFGSASLSYGDKSMTVTQDSDKAILNWQTFDIADGYKAQFVQPNAQAVALNKVWDVSGDVSRIFGELQANGQVYLINRNGVLFGEHARIDVNSLLVSTLRLDDETFKNGILSAFTDNSPPQPAFTGFAEDDGGKASGNITVAAGARIASQSGGRIVLLAPAIDNEGEISSPQGQVVLAVGEQAYLFPHSAADVRGLQVEVAGEGGVVNGGTVSAPLGNVTLVGRQVAQNGRVSASTSVQLNGSVFLLARSDPLFDASKKISSFQVAGEVTLGQDSLTEILPEIADLTRAIDEQLQPHSRVDIQGQSIHLQSGAAVVAPSGEVTVGDKRRTQRVYLESGSRIDVAGSSDVLLPMESNVIGLQLRGNELRDSPWQRDSILYGQTIYVDVRKGTPLADISGAVAAIGRTVAERTTAGGNISLQANGDVVLEAGAVLDVSGGSVRYSDGLIATTKLLSNGRIYDISQASPDLVYDRIINTYEQLDYKWGQRRQWVSFYGGDLGAQFQSGYSEGRDAGSISIIARDMALYGSLRAEVLQGEMQRLPAQAIAADRAWTRPYDQLPLGGQLVLGDARGATSSETPDLYTPDVVFANDLPALPLSYLQPLHADGGRGSVVLTPELLAHGLSRVEIYSNGSISVPQDVDLSLPAGGSLKLVAGGSPATGAAADTRPPALAIDGRLQLPAGSVTLVTLPTSASAMASARDSRVLAIRVDDGASIDVSGRWVNDNPLLSSSASPTPLWIDGGSIALVSAGDLQLLPQSRLQADGGAWRDSSGRLTAGRGGAISLGSTFADPSGAPPLVQLAGELRAYAISQGGSLSLKAPGFYLAETMPESLPPNAVYLAPAFFSRGGFSQFTLQATHSGLRLENDTVLVPRQQNWEFSVDPNLLPGGADLATATRLVLLPDVDRAAVNLSFSAKFNAASTSSALILGEGSRIDADAGACIQLQSDRAISVDGVVRAAGGEVALRVVGDSALYLPDRGIVLGDQALIDVSALFLATPGDELGHRAGRMLDAGNIVVDSDSGPIVADPGSVLRLDGAVATVDVLTTTGSGRNYAALPLVGEAGVLSVRAADGMLLAGELSARAASIDGAEGGELHLQLSGRTINDGQGQQRPYPLGERVFRIQQTLAGDGLTDRLAAFYTPVEEAALRVGQGLQVDAVAYIAADILNDSGAATVVLQAIPVSQNGILPGSESVIEFAGAIDLHAGRALSLDATILRAADGEIHLTAPYLALGPSLDLLYRSPDLATPGSAQLTAEADFIDLVGDLSLQGFGAAGDAGYAARFISQNDIRLRGVSTVDQLWRFSGSLSSSGDLYLQAAQIYPISLTDYTIRAPGGRIVIAGNGDSQAPLSAGGRLSLEAAVIEQGGTLRAPQGELVLQADERLTLAAGSTTSVAADGGIVPLGETQFGVDWILPLSDRTQVIDGPAGQASSLPLPVKSVDLQAPSIDMQVGSTVDLSGDGDLLAYEFVPGRGGSHDVLAPQYIGQAFAVLPLLGSDYAPVSPLIANEDIRPGDSIYLAGGNGLPAGRYAVLPARYALLPGAYLVTPVSAPLGFTPGDAFQRVDQRWVVAGKGGVAGTAFSDATWSAYLLESQAQLTDPVHMRAEYQISLASDFFTTRARDAGVAAGLLPSDSGRLLVDADTRLRLAGQVQAASGSGRGGLVDIVADDLAVVTAPTGASDRVEIVAADLDGLGANSILLGGQRHYTAEGTVLDISAGRVSIDAGVDLQLPELLLAAATPAAESGQAGTIAIADGVHLDAAGNGGSHGETVIISGDSALLRLSTGEQVTLNRQAPAPAAQASITTGVGAVLAAGSVDAQGARQGGAILLDAADTASGAKIELGDGGALYLGAAQISIGETDGAAEHGLVLSNATLQQLQVSRLELVSRDAIEFYGQSELSAEELTVRAARLRAHGDHGVDAQLSAGDLTLEAAGGGAAAGPVAMALSSDNRLRLSADRIDFTAAAGASAADATPTLAIEGFAQVQIAAGEEIRLRGRGHWQSDGDVQWSSGRTTGGADTQWDLTSAGKLVMLTVEQAQAMAAVATLGGRLAFSAEDIQFDGEVDLPAGELRLHAVGAGPGGDIVLGEHARVRLNGNMTDYADLTVAAPGGHLLLNSEHGDIRSAPTASIDVSAGAAAATAGGIQASATHGQVDLAGDITANNHGGERAGGDLVLDAADIANLNGFNARLNGAGFNGMRVLRQRQGDITIDGTGIVAADIALTADDGFLTIAGTLDASGEQAGRIVLNSRGDLQLQSGSRLLAGAGGEDQLGGSVLLNSRQGFISVAAGAVIDVHGTRAVDLPVTRMDAAGVRQTLTDDQGRPLYVASTDSGRVEFNAARAQRAVLVDDNGQPLRDAGGHPVYATDAQGRVLLIVFGADGRPANFTADARGVLHDAAGRAIAGSGVMDAVAVTQLAGEISGAAAVEIHGMQVYNDADGVITGSDVATTGRWYGDAAQFMASEQRILADLGFSSQQDHRLHLRPGVDVETAAAMSLPDWDLASWRFGATQEPGLLVLRAGGDLRVNGTVSDGTVARADLPVISDLLSGDSWSIELVAGADAASADRLATATPASLALDAGARVRTGSGRIDVGSGGDLRFGAGASIYTLGRNTGSGTLDPLLQLLLHGGVFGEGGGEVRIDAGGDIVGDDSEQRLSAWQARIGDQHGDNTGYGPVPTAWAIRVDDFHHNVGALGGGNVSIRSGGDVSDLSVMLPSTARQQGSAYFDGTRFIVDSDVISERGGGDLRVQADGDIRGGVYYVARGTGRLQAGGTLTAGTRGNAPTVLASDGRYRLQAHDDLHLLAVLDPMVLPMAPDQGELLGTSIEASYFYSYSDRAAVDLQSLTGNVYLSDENPNAKLAYLESTMGHIPRLAQVMPGNLAVRALQGDIVLDLSPLELYPVADGQLQLLAYGSIRQANNLQATLLMLDGDPAILPRATRSWGSTLVEGNGSLPTELFPSQFSDPYRLPPQPIHLQDGAPVYLVTRTGSIGPAGGGTQVLEIRVPKPVVLQAQQDVRNLDLWIQHNQANEVSLVQAVSGDIVQTRSRDGATGVFNSTNLQYRVDGPGSLQLLAGGDIDLGTSDGVVSMGNLGHPGLADQGANLTFIAGVPVLPDWDGYVDGYFQRLSAKEATTPLAPDDSAGSQIAVSAALQRLFKDAGAVTAGEAPSLAAYRQLPAAQRQALAMRLLLQELGELAQNARISGGENYNPSYELLAKVFGGASTGEQGNLILMLSQIKTLDGGSISLLVPHGRVDAGITANNAVAKTPEQLGMVVSREGDIYALVDANFNVNQSRIFTLGGGNIMVWSSYGDIDAGRGAKTAIALAGLTHTLDVDGNLVIDFPPAAAGSGIRAFCPQNGCDAGDKPVVALFAPHGTIDAGEAGIGSEGDVILGAPQIKGADNIDVGGVGIGVPVADSGGLAADLSGVSGLGSSAGNAADDAMGDNGDKSGTPIADTAMGFLEVEILGYGGRNCQDQETAAQAGDCKATPAAEAGN